MKDSVPLLRIVLSPSKMLAAKPKPKKHRVVKRKPLMHPVMANPNPIEAVVVYRAQSILTMDGQIGPILSFAQAQDVVKWAEAGARYIPSGRKPFKWWF